MNRKTVGKIDGKKDKQTIRPLVYQQLSWRNSTFFSKILCQENDVGRKQNRSKTEARQKQHRSRTEAKQKQDRSRTEVYNRVRGKQEKGGRIKTDKRLMIRKHWPY